MELQYGLPVSHLVTYLQVNLGFQTGTFHSSFSGYIVQRPLGNGKLACYIEMATLKNGTHENAVD